MSFAKAFPLVIRRFPFQQTLDELACVHVSRCLAEFFSGDVELAQFVLDHLGTEYALTGGFLVAVITGDAHFLQGDLDVIRLESRKSRACFGGPPCGMRLDEGEEQNPTLHMLEMSTSRLSWTTWSMDEISRSCMLLIVLLTFRRLTLGFVKIISIRPTGWSCLIRKLSFTSSVGSIWNTRILAHKFRGIYWKRRWWLKKESKSGEPEDIKSSSSLKWELMSCVPCWCVRKQRTIEKRCSSLQKNGILSGQIKEFNLII